LAQLYADSLRDKTTVKAIKSALHQFQEQAQDSSKDHRVEMLAEAYQQTMERIKGQKQGFWELAKNVFAWITYAKRPLTTLELQHALSVEVSASKLDEKYFP
jgi:hypothetical protein